MGAILDQIQSDIRAAMKAGDRKRVGVLRLLASELQKDVKEGAGDELAVLRRERKRRLDAAEQFASGDRADLAAGEREEATTIEGYLPAAPSADELRTIVAAAIERTGASSPKDMGAVMKAVMAETGGNADGKVVSGLVREALTG